MQMVNVRLEKAGKRSEERRLVKSLLLRYFSEDGKRCMEEAGAMLLGEDEDL